MTWLLGIIAFISLLVLGLWLPVLWIVAGVLLVVLVLYGIGLARARSGSSDADATPHR